MPKYVSFIFSLLFFCTFRVLFTRIKFPFLVVPMVHKMCNTIYTLASTLGIRQHSCNSTFCLILPIYATSLKKYVSPTVLNVFRHFLVNSYLFPPPCPFCIWCGHVSYCFFTFLTHTKITYLPSPQRLYPVGIGMINTII